MTFLFLDTNDFLHFKSFLEIEWATLADGDQYTIVLAPTVVDELDQKKTHPNKRISSKAKAAIERFDKIDDGEITFNLHSIPNRPDDETYKKNKLSVSVADDGILASILEFDVIGADRKILVTNDRGIRVRAKSLGIQAIKLPEEYRLPEELNEDEKEIKALKQELNHLKNRLPKVSLVFDSRTNRLNHTIDKMRFNKDEYIKRGAERNKRRHPHWKNKEENNDVPVLFRTFALSSVTNEQIDEYNSELDAYYIQYEQYLVKEYEYKEYLLRCIEINIHLVNDGTLPAEDTDIYLHFPDGFLLLKELPKEPEKPRAPVSPRSIFDPPPMPRISSLQDALNRINSGRDPNAPYLSRLDKTNSYEVEFKVPNVKHNMSQPLPKLFAIFQTEEAMKSFNIEYALRVANLPDKQDGDLHVIIEAGI